MFSCEAGVLSTIGTCKSCYDVKFVFLCETNICCEIYVFVWTWCFMRIWYLLWNTCFHVRLVFYANLIFIVKHMFSCEAGVLCEFDICCETHVFMWGWCFIWFRNWYLWNMFPCEIDMWKSCFDLKLVFVVKYGFIWNVFCYARLICFMWSWCFYVFLWACFCAKLKFVIWDWCLYVRVVFFHETCVFLRNSYSYISLRFVCRISVLHEIYVLMWSWYFYVKLMYLSDIYVWNCSFYAKLIFLYETNILMWNWCCFICNWSFLCMIFFIQIWCF